MDTATPNTATTADAMANQMTAWERLERAETEVRIAALRIDTLVADAPLRMKGEARERHTRAEAELDAAQAAYDAAQDLDGPEEGQAMITTTDIGWHGCLAGGPR